MQLNFNFSGITLLKDWWGIVRDNFTTVQTLFNTHQIASVLDHPDKSVTTAKIADKAVGAAKIADYSIGPTQLAQYAVSSAKIYPAAVLTTHIKDGNVTKEKLEASLQNQLTALNSESADLSGRVTALEEQGGRLVDSELSETSENPVQNKVIAAALDSIPVKKTITADFNDIKEPGLYTITGTGNCPVDPELYTSHFFLLVGHLNQRGDVVQIAAMELSRNMWYRYMDPDETGDNWQIWTPIPTMLDDALIKWSENPVKGSVLKDKFDLCDSKLEELESRIAALEGGQ